MNTGAKLAIAGVGTVVLVAIIYAVMKKGSNTAVTSAPPPVSQPEVPVINYNDKKIDVSNVSRPVSAPVPTSVPIPGATYNPPPIPGGIGYFKNKPPMIARD